MMKSIGTGLRKLASKLGLGLCVALGLLMMQAAAAPSTGSDSAQAASSAPEAGSWVAQWGPAIGARAPAIEAPDHTGATRTLADLAGENGLLLMLNRSADW